MFRNHPDTNELPLFPYISSPLVHPPALTASMAISIFVSCSSILYETRTLNKIIHILRKFHWIILYYFRPCVFYVTGMAGMHSFY